MSNLKLAICKDVLGRISSGSLSIKRNVYLVTKNDSCYDDLVKIPFGKTIEESDLDLISRECEVCALGAMLLSLVSKTKKCPADKITGKMAGVFKVLREVFPLEQLNLIEDYFEFKWVDKYPEDVVRLRQIMENCVKNKGNFIP